MRTKVAKSKTPVKNANGVLECTEVLTLDETAAYLRVSAECVLQMIETQDLPARKLGPEWRFFKTAIQAWLSRPRKRTLLDHAGEIAGDPYMEEMLREIYKERGRPEVEPEDP